MCGFFGDRIVAMERSMDFQKISFRVQGFAKYNPDNGKSNGKEHD